MTKSMPRKRRRSRTHYIQRAALVVAVLAAGAALVVGLQTDYWKQFYARMSDSLKAPNHSKRTASEPGEPSAFDSFLARSTPQQLILKSTELSDSSEYSLVDRLDRQQRRILIAEKLISFEKDSRARAFGLSSRLRALRTRAMINFDHGLTVHDELEQLNRLAVDQIVSADENIKREACLARLVTRLIQNFSAAGDKNLEAFEATLGEFRAVGQQFPADAEVADELFSCLERIHANAMPEVFDDFAEQFSRIYVSSDREPLRQLAANAKTSIAQAEFEFVDVLGARGTDEKELASLLASQIREALDRATISQQGHVEIFAGIRVLASLGRYPAALELADLLQRRLAGNDSLQSLAATLRKHRQQFRLVGKPFSLTGIETLDNEPLGIGSGDAAVIAILFTTAETMDAAQQATGFMLKTAGKLVAEKRFSMSLILLDDGGHESVLQDLKRLSKLAPTVAFGRIDVNSPAGHQALQQLAPTNSPTVILLDRDKVTRHVNINRMEFEKQIDELVQPIN